MKTMTVNGEVLDFAPNDHKIKLLKELKALFKRLKDENDTLSLRYVAKWQTGLMNDLLKDLEADE